jgi:ABC-type branched-subunit amino acid transport system substrate-binding protein
MDDFVARYKKKYNADVQIYSPYVYDAVMTMAAAMQQANSAQPASTCRAAEDQVSGRDRPDLV